MAFVMPSRGSIKAHDTGFHSPDFLNIFHLFYWPPCLHIPQVNKVKVIGTGYLPTGLVPSTFLFLSLIGKAEGVLGDFLCF
jgi:hypothetical protein